MNIEFLLHFLSIGLISMVTFSYFIRFYKPVEAIILAMLRSLMAGLCREIYQEFFTDGNFGWMDMAYNCISILVFLAYQCTLYTKTILKNANKWKEL